MDLNSLLMKIGDESILFFSRVSLSKFSLEALFLSWVKGVFILGVRMECEESGFSKQGWLVTWPHRLTESQVLAAR